MRHSEAVSWVLLLALPICFGAGDYLAGQYSKTLSPWAVIAVASVVASAGALIWALHDGKLEFDGIVLIEGSISGLLLLLANVLFYKALATGKAGIVGGIVTLSIIVPVAFDMRQGTLPDSTSLIGILAIVLGVIVISQPRSLEGMSKKSLLLSFGAALAFGVQFVALDRVSATNTDMGVVVQFATAAVVVAFVGLLLRTSGGLGRSTIRGPIFVGLLFCIGGLCLSAAMIDIDISIATAVLLTEPIVLALLDFAIRRERLNAMQSVALVTVIAGAVVATIG